MSDPVYAIVVVVHVLVALIGFGAIGITGAYATKARRLGAPTENRQLRRYFRSGRNLAARAILLVPLLGVALLGLNRWQDAHAPWPWIGLSLWFVAISVASAVLWPAESGLQTAFADDPPTRLDDAAVIALARRAERAAALISCCFVAALVVMIAQP